MQMNVKQRQCILLGYFELTLSECWTLVYPLKSDLQSIYVTIDE